MTRCTFRWPWPSAVNEVRVIFHWCAKESGHGDEHECQCSSAKHGRHTHETKR